MSYRAYGKGRSQPKRVGMNKTELAYAEFLRERKMLGEVLDYEYEPVTFSLAKNTRYTPDFLVVMADLTIEIHEVKACRASGAFLCEDDARAKWKIAAEKNWMFTFRMCGKLPKNAGWRIETYDE